ncbi:MAG TPA: sulfotransferase [Vicinamibacterales bacterium]
MSDRVRAGAPRDPKPLLIMGSPRSGTTFLSQMVNRFFDFHISRDNGTLLRFHRLLRNYEPLADDANLRRLIRDLYQDHFFTSRIRQRGMGLSEDELFRRVRTRTYGGLIEAVFQANAEQHGKRHWGYKRASFGRVKGNYVDDLFPEARFVHIIRDARDVVLSMRNTPKVLLERSWHFAAVDWVSHVETGRRIGRSLGPDRYLELRYETLMADPVNTMLTIFEFAGSGPDGDTRAQKLRNEIGGLIKANNVEKWRRMMPSPALRRVERVAGPLLGTLGYPVVDRDVAGQPVGRLELACLYVDRIARNLFTRNIPMMIRYRLEVFKALQRSRSRGAGQKPQPSSVQ